VKGIIGEVLKGRIGVRQFCQFFSDHLKECFERPFLFYESTSLASKSRASRQIPSIHYTYRAVYGWVKKNSFFRFVAKFFLTFLPDMLIFLLMKGNLLSTLCPCCGLPMQTAAMSCPTCEVKIEGNFGETVFGRLTPEDQQFLEQYLLAGFSIKTLEQNSALGYAAIRSRLDRLIANCKVLVKRDAQKKAVLDQLRAGEISVAEAKEKLKKLSRG
jgi:hypothetical protein